MLSRAVWIFFHDLGVVGMHIPLCRQWASTWAWTVGFLEIRFSTCLNTFHKTNFYLCSSANVDRETSCQGTAVSNQQDAQSLPHTQVSSVGWLPSPLSHPYLPCPGPLFAWEERRRSHWLGTGLRGPVSLAAAELTQKTLQQWCPGLDSSWAGSPLGVLPKKKIQVSDSLKKGAHVRQTRNLWHSPPPSSTVTLISFSFCLHLLVAWEPPTMGFSLLRCSAVFRRLGTHADQGSYSYQWLSRSCMSAK